MKSAYKVGESVACIVSHAENTGYAIKTVKDGLPGFIQTKRQLEPGQEILAVFVCAHNGRLLLTELFTRPSYRSPHRHRRAVDFFPPPVDLKSIRDSLNYTTGSAAAKTLLAAQIEQKNRTGCIKTSSSKFKSRAAALLLNGRFVGCTHTKHHGDHAMSAMSALSAMSSDLNDFATDVIVYDLPEEIVRPMSAIFFGERLSTEESDQPQSLVKKRLRSLQKNKTTACLTIFDRKQDLTIVIYVHQGKFSGLFVVEWQHFSRERSELAVALEQCSSATVLVDGFISNNAEDEQNKPIGYSLSDLKGGGTKR